MFQLFTPPLSEPDQSLPKGNSRIAQDPKLKIPVSMFFNMDGYSVKNGVAEISFDLILSESHTLTSIVSSHPVQDGSVISDHIINDLRKGGLKGLVSNFSITRESFDTTEALQVSAGQEVIRGVSSNAAADVWKAFKLLHEARQLVTITTVLEVYDNVAITNVATSRDGTSGEALVFEVTFQQVKSVKLKETTITAQTHPKKMDTELNRQASAEIDTGRKTGTTVTTEELEAVP